ncbi:hypothetical protein [Ferirhizobium litorale]|uniref:Methyltransferase domain-containing protein n=1 Tax=Ferirhizobium litorale TaxID=2927786 RepID=A0AAE3U485_9HYPH|nr:hypothetical protein [Fererhizobium litorale]MDI7924612.1 hypothetical protein [Fererhizobium litorale]
MARQTQYQQGPRWEGVRLNVAMIGNFLSAEAKSAIDIGCNEGFIACALTELGAKCKGFEANPVFLETANRLKETFGRGTVFQNKIVSMDDLKGMEPVDVSLLLSVHHQIAANSSLDHANEFLRMLASKTRMQFFFQPACIADKYGEAKPPFAENDYAAIKEYFDGVLASAGMTHSTFIGFSINDMPTSEPLRPMYVYSREPIGWRHSAKVDDLLHRLRDARDLVNPPAPKATKVAKPATVTQPPSVRPKEKRRKTLLQRVLGR